MSGPDRPDAVEATTRSLKRKDFPDREQQDLAALDNIFKRIKVAVPHVPYILSTPSMSPYRYHSQQEANAWMMGRLWKHDEEHIRYRTYLYREPCQDCFELQAGEEDEPEPRQLASQSSTAVKKKVNISNFKVKHANGTVTPGLKVTSPQLAATKQASQLRNGVDAEKLAVVSQSKDSKSPKASSTPSRDERKSDRPGQDNPRADRPRPTSHKQDPVETKVTTDRSNSSNATPTPHGLPPLLSPVHDPLGNPHGLPNILSPTLPSNIQEELDKLEVQRKRAESNASTSSSDRKSQTLAVPNAQTQKRDDTPKPEIRIRSVSINGKSPNLEATKKTEEKRPSLVVKFKFTKQRLSTFQALVKLPPKRTISEKKERRDTPKDSSDTPMDTPAKLADATTIKKKPIPKNAARRAEPSIPAPTPTPTVKVAAPTTKVAEKRPRALGGPSPPVPSGKVAEKRPRPDDVSSPAIPSKRPRASSTLDRPITPAHQAISPPSLSNKSTAQKAQPQYTTPKKDHKTVNMLRTNSTDSIDSTPGRSGSTPAGGKSEAKAAPTSAPLNSKKQADISLLSQTSMKLNQMGRALKHEATKILSVGDNRLTKQDAKRAAVTNLECILSYMAAYYAQDLSLTLRGRPGEVEQTWKTLLPLCLSYARSTKDFKHLDGLRSYLSAVIASAICMHVSARASISSSRAHDSPQDIAHAELAKQHTSLTENFALLADHTGKMNRHYQDARIALSAEDLQTHYRKTYAGQETNASLIREPEKVNGARMSGPYFLPLAVDTTPIQAVRFGLKFLAEYCEKEKLDYTFKVNLDKPA